MLDSWDRLGVATEREAANLRVEGCGGQLPNRQADLFVANSGTTIRFMTAVLAACGGEFQLDGIERMRQRPILDLVDALRQLGGEVECEDGCPPVTIRGQGLSGGHTQVRGNLSSQFLSGLLMAAPLARGDVTIEVTGELVSKPYVDITLAVMRRFGVEAETVEGGFRVGHGQTYRPLDFEVEPDATAASYFWSAAAIAGGAVTVEGLSESSLQGDVAFCDCLEQMGCRVEHRSDGITVTGGQLRGIDVDMNAISDTAQTLAAVALFADGPTRIRGIAHNRHKETDRVGDLSRELRKLGAVVDEYDDGLQIHPGALRGAEVETYNDHRMAMSLALVGLQVPGVRIRDPECTSKTYPHFFADLARVAGKP